MVAKTDEWTLLEHDTETGRRIAIAAVANAADAHVFARIIWLVVIAHVNGARIHIVAVRQLPDAGVSDGVVVRIRAGTRSGNAPRHEFA